MLRWSKIPETYRPEIISDISDDMFYALVVQDWDFRKIKRSDYNAVAMNTGKDLDSFSSKNHYVNVLIDKCWEGNCGFRSFIKLVQKNVPYTLMHKAKSEIFSDDYVIVCFMTGECNDVFLIHEKDLTEWDPEEET